MRPMKTDEELLGTDTNTAILEVLLDIRQCLTSWRCES